MWLKNLLVSDVGAVINLDWRSFNPQVRESKVDQVNNWGFLLLEMLDFRAHFFGLWIPMRSLFLNWIHYFYIAASKTNLKFHVATTKRL